MARMAFWAGIALFIALSVFLFLFGWLYASVGKMLPFHAAAVPEAARGEVLALYLALMKLIGGASAGLGLLGLYSALVPLRQGMKSAGLLIFATYSLAFIMAAFVAERLADATGAPTSWHIMGILMTVNIVALTASLLGQGRRMGA